MYVEVLYMRKANKTGMVTALISFFLIPSFAFAVDGEEKDAKSSLSPGVEALIDSGLERCINELNAMVRENTAKNDGYGYLTHPSATANKNGSSLITAADFSDGTMLNIFHVVPDAGNGCSLVATMSFIAKESCAKIRDKTFRDWRLNLDLGASTAYKHKTEETYHNSVILTPDSGGGCVATKVFTLNYLEQ
jgi:hypothetical protein